VKLNRELIIKKNKTQPVNKEISQIIIYQ